MRNRVQLTDARAAKVAPTRGDPQPELWDQNCRGLYVRGGVRGNVLIFEKMIRGTRLREQLGPVAELTVADARRQAMELAKAWDAQTEHRSRIPTLKDAAVRYAVERELRQSPTASHAYSFRKYMPNLEPKPVNRIRDADVLAIWEDLADKPGARRMAFKHLREVLNFFGRRYRFENVVERAIGDLGKSEPVPLIQQWEGQRGLANWGAFLREARLYAGQDVAVLFELIALTGTRPNEWNARRWDDLHLDEGIAVFRRHKTDDTAGARIFPLSKHVVELLIQHRQHTEGEWMFPSRKGCKDPHLANSACRALLAHVEGKVGYKLAGGMYQTRKFFVTEAENAGATESDIDYLCGQSVAGVRVAYSFRNAEGYRDILERVTARLVKAICTSAADKAKSPTELASA